MKISAKAIALYMGKPIKEVLEKAKEFKSKKAEKTWYFTEKQSELLVIALFLDISIRQAYKLLKIYRRYKCGI